MKSQSVSDWLFYGFSLHPQNLAEVFGFCAVMFIVMLAFYVLGQWLHNTGHGPKMKAIADKMEVFQNRLAGRAYKDMTRSVDQIDKKRRWPFGRRQ